MLPMTTSTSQGCSVVSKDLAPINFLTSPTAPEDHAWERRFGLFYIRTIAIFHNLEISSYF